MTLDVTAVVDSMSFFTAFRCEMSFETERETRLKRLIFRLCKTFFESRQNQQSQQDLFITNKDVCT